MWITFPLIILIWYFLNQIQMLRHSLDSGPRGFFSGHNPTIYPYTSVIDGFASSGSHLWGIRLYSKMLHESSLPDNYLMASILKARGSTDGLWSWAPAQTFCEVEDGVIRKMRGIGGCTSDVWWNAWRRYRVHRDDLLL